MIHSKVAKANIETFNLFALIPFVNIISKILHKGKIGQNKYESKKTIFFIYENS